jgi:hypothetical protein
MRLLDRVLPWRRKRIEAVTAALFPQKRAMSIDDLAKLLHPGVEKWFEEAFDDQVLREYMRKRYIGTLFK